MKKIIATILIMLCCAANAASILWAALDESSVIEYNGLTQPFLNFSNAEGLTINAARLSVGSGSAYSADSVVQLALWIPEYTDPDTGEYQPAGWETEFPVITLVYDGDYWGMPKWSSQFNLGDDPDPNTNVFFELGYVDWDDYDSPFTPLAYTQSTIGILDSNPDHIYPSGTLFPPDEANWMPTHFYAVPEPSIALLALLGVGMLLKRRK